MSGKSKYKVGDEFPNGKRLVEYMGSHPKWRTSLWMWECMECGTLGGPSLTNSLTRPRKPACCAPKKMLGKDNPRWLGYEELTGVFLGQYKWDAERKGREWSVSPEYLWQLWLDQDKRCAYTGWELTHGKDASLDRIDSSLGYKEGNVQWVHRDINRMKSDFTAEYFLRLCLAVQCARL